MKREPGKIRNVLYAGLIAAALASCAPANAQTIQIEELERLADRGEAKALYHLGMMYLTGSSVGQDQERAVE